MRNRSRGLPRFELADPAAGFGVGRAGPGVRPALGAPGIGVAPGAPLYVLPKGCVAVVVNGVKMWRCGTIVYRPVLQAGRTVYVVVR